MRSGVCGVTLAPEAETLARVSANMFLKSGDLEYAQHVPSAGLLATEEQELALAAAEAATLAALAPTTPDAGGPAAAAAAAVLAGMLVVAVPAPEAIKRSAVDDVVDDGVEVAEETEAGATAADGATVRAVVVAA